MGNSLIIALWFGGGLLAAFVSLLIASFLGRLLILRTFFCVLSLLALLAQGGCWHILAGIGNATGGGADEWEQQKYVVFGFIVWVFWTLCLIVFSVLRPRKPDSN